MKGQRDQRLALVVPEHLVNDHGESSEQSANH
jgi:hypothetical protein